MSLLATSFITCVAIQCACSGKWKSHACMVPVTRITGSFTDYCALVTNRAEKILLQRHVEMIGGMALTG